MLNQPKNDDIKCCFKSETELTRIFVIRNEVTKTENAVSMILRFRFIHRFHSFDLYNTLIFSKQASKTYNSSARFDSHIRYQV